jgi:hypothetical protein
MRPAFAQHRSSEMADNRNGGGNLRLKPSGDKSPYVLGAGLGIIIAAALGITIWQFIGDDDPGGGPANAEIQAPFECMACGKEFKKELLVYDEAGGAMPVDCELCGKTQCAVAMQKCHGCGKYCLSEAMKLQARYAIAAMKPGAKVDLPQVGDNICPKCNCNITEYWRKRARNLPGAKGR